MFEGIHEEFSGLLDDARLHAIPMSALHGDNVITRSERTPWFEGPRSERVTFFLDQDVPDDMAHWLRHRGHVVTCLREVLPGVQARPPAAALVTPETSDRQA